MALPLYADECVDMRIVAGLRRRGVEIRTALEDQLLGTSDERQLEHARTRGCVVVTCDVDFLRMAHELADRGEHHPGVLFVRPETRVGDAVRAIALVASALEFEDMQDWIEWIP